MTVQGDTLTVLRSLPPESVQMVCTSPPYWQLRNYGDPRQYGLERHPKQWLARQRAVCREIRRVLRKDGVFWLNCGDSFGGGRGEPGKKSETLNSNICSVKEGWYQRKAIRDGAWLQPKQLLMLPARLAILLQNDRWILRNDIVWYKPNAMPESVSDRCSTKHEHLFLFAKSRKYTFRLDRIRVPYKPSSQERLLHPWNGETKRGYAGPGPQHHIGRYLGKTVEEAAKQPDANPGDVWDIPTQPFPECHYAVFPERLVERCVLAGSDEGDLVLDPYMGSGTVGVVAHRLNRRFLGIELSVEYCRMAAKRMRGRTLPLALGI